MTMVMLDGGISFQTRRCGQKISVGFEILILRAVLSDRLFVRVRRFEHGNFQGDYCSNRTPGVSCSEFFCDSYTKL